MVAPSAGAVILVPFPFSDLSQSKMRPAVVLADADRGDWISCQITSNSYADARALELTEESFKEGSLRRTSYVRPGKLFTLNQRLIVSQVGKLKDRDYRRIVEAVVKMVRGDGS